MYPLVNKYVFTKSKRPQQGVSAEGVSKVLRHRNPGVNCKSQNPVHDKELTL